MLFWRQSFNGFATPGEVRMRIGIPREVKTLEGRVALVPEACSDLVHAGHRVLVETGAGEASGFADSAYAEAGVEVVGDAAALYGEAELIVKVKEPQPAELGYLRPDHRLFCYLHLAAFPGLTERLLDIGLTAIGFETVEVDGQLPLLEPMSRIAGRLSAQIGGTLLHRPGGGAGVLLGGIPGTPPGRVVVIGAGHAGGSAVALAAALGARVTVFDLDLGRLATMRGLGGNIEALYPYAASVDAAVRDADLLVGAVLVPGARAPEVVSEEQVAGMRPGSVVADISIDQGGCVATSRPTTYDAPTYTCHGVTHFTVANMPGAVPRTASQALSAAISPWVARLARADWREDAVLAGGVNLSDGELILPALRV